MVRNITRYIDTFDKDPWPLSHAKGYVDGTFFLFALYARPNINKCISERTDRVLSDLETTFSTASALYQSPPLTLIWPFN